MACAVDGVPPDVDVAVAVTVQFPAAGSTTEFPPQPVTPFTNAAVPGPDADQATVAIVPFVHDTINGSEVPTVTGPAGASVQATAVGGGVTPLGEHVSVRVLASQLQEQVPWSLIVADALSTGAAASNDAAATAKTAEHASTRVNWLKFIPSS